MLTTGIPKLGLDVLNGALLTLAALLTVKREDHAGRPGGRFVR